MSDSVSNSIVRTRFAPSPTGELHVGGARTALYELLLAHHFEGQYLLRVEDTDQQRYVPGSMERFFADLQWLGLTPDEGPGGSGAPVTSAPDGGSFIQSERTAGHHQLAEALVERGAAYYDFSSAAGGGDHEEAEYRSGRVVYRGADRDLALAEARRRVAAGEPHVIRLKVPTNQTIQFTDLVRGTVSFKTDTLEDTVLMKSDGFATYHVANVADDHAMGITHVLRAEEWLPSTPKHLLMYQAMGWTPPAFAHVSFILAADGKKLSKRLHGEAVWVKTYRERGYLPEALLNYLALIGWNPGGDREFFTLAELVEVFSIDRLHKAGGMFDEAKLDAFQQHYVRELTDDQLATKLSEYLEERSLPKPAGPQFGRLMRVLHDRLGRFDEFATLAGWVDAVADYPSERLTFRKSTSESTKTGLAAAITVLEAAEPASWDTVEVLSNLLATVVLSNGLTNGDVFWPVRLALTGLDQSPSPAECLWVLGRAESLRRLQTALEKLA